MRLVSNTPRMEMLRIERAVGRAPSGSCLEQDEFLHLCVLLGRLRTADSRFRSEVLTKLLKRGFDHRYATNLMGLAAAGIQPLSMLVRQAALHSEIPPIDNNGEVKW